MDNNLINELRLRHRQEERTRMATELQKGAQGASEAQNHLARIIGRGVTYSYDERMRADELYDRISGLAIEIIEFSLTLQEQKSE